MRIGGNVGRAALLALAAPVCLGAGCPFEQSDRVPEAETWTEEVFLRVGESAEVDDGQLVVTVLTVDAGSRLGTVTVRLAGADGRSTEEVIDVVRNALLSEAARLEPYAVRVMGFPGVDSARLQVSREPAGGQR
ncbi:MAG: hypothetical protein ACREMD_10750 [Gemmatimonadota bacterium]